MSNFWRDYVALSPDTEIWWDSSTLVWPNFKEDFVKQVPETDRSWFRKEVESMLYDAPVGEWLFRGCTTNPPLSWDVLKTRKEEWAGVIREKRKNYKGRSKYGLFLEVYYEVVKRGAEKLLPLFEASGGKHGHISGQVDMQLMRNESAMKEMGEKLASLSPNVMVKIPGSTQGIPVFRHLASRGIATNATCVFTVPQILAVGKSVAEGREIHLKENKTPRQGWRAVCTHMSGRLEDSKAFRGVIDKDNLDINARELRVASEAVVKKCARIYRERNYPVKMLLCSARLHRYRDGSWGYPHVEMFAGGDYVNTVPPKVFGQCMLFYKDRKPVARWNDAPDPSTLAKLAQVKYFTQAFEEDGFAVEQFNEITSLIENEAEFVGATREMLEHVGSFL
jgi:transaldolase